MIKDEAYNEFVAALGAENVSREPAVLDGYAWQPTNNDNPEGNWVIRPVAAVLPSSTEEVQEVVRVCNRHALKFRAFSTGWGAWAGPTMENVVIVDLRRMNRIVDIDARNMYAVIEPYVCGAQLQAEAMKVGLNTHIIGAGPNCSPLASATSGWGVGHDSIYMSYSARNVLGVEWVLPSGEVLRLGTLGSSSDWFNGDGPASNSSVDDHASTKRMCACAPRPGRILPPGRPEAARGEPGLVAHRAGRHCRHGVERRERISCPAVRQVGHVALGEEDLRVVHLDQLEVLPGAGGLRSRTARRPVDCRR